MDENYHLYTFSNGIRLIHKEVTNTRIAHCGFILDIGSRDEQENEQGLAHFWEHMAFKGTHKRKAHHIINRLEIVGGELNAYTDKEKICFYASFVDKHYEKAIELLSDITFNSSFPPHQIERERQVILEEMAMYQDIPEDALQDEFEDVLFANHSLGHNILGTKDSIKSFRKTDFQQFIQRNLNTNAVVFSSVANIPFKRILKWAEKYIANIPKEDNLNERKKFKTYQAQKNTKIKANEQAYCALGGISYSLHDKKRSNFFMLNNILGGPNFNARLNVALREKNGLVYHIESSFTPFTDTGFFAIYFATEQKHLEKSLKLVNTELKRLREKKLGVIQLHNAKEQILGQLAMAEENNLNFMLMMGKSILDFGKIESLEVVLKKINDTSAEMLQDIAQEVFIESNISQLLYVSNSK